MRRRPSRLVFGLALLAASGVRAAEPLALSAPDPQPRLGTCGGSGGGFVLPGTAGCLRLGGLVRAEGRWRSTTPIASSLALPFSTLRASSVAPTRPSRAGLGTSARLTADLRLPTELGPVRVYVSLRGPQGFAADRAVH